ncbi:MAG: class II glutamine amidotransferase [Methanobacterium sp.]
MCELLGLCFNRAVRPNLSFKGFRIRSEENPDGWGIAFYPDISAQIIKEPLEAEVSLLSEFIENYPKIRSEIFISHVRLNSVSEPAFMNTHPFQRELNGKEFVFAHNGTLSNYEKDFDTTEFERVGKTDSEAAFCHLMNKIREKKAKSWDNSGFEWLYEEIKYINGFGKFNCIFSDGEYLFCYYDMNGYKGLFHLHREAPYDHTHLSDEHFDVNLKKQGETEKKGYIIATRPLTDEKWYRFDPGELIVMKNGRIVYKIQ